MVKAALATNLDLFKNLPKSTKGLKASGDPEETPEPSIPSEKPEPVPADEPAEDDESGGEEEAPAASMTELDMLKSRATLMGISFSNNISVDVLRARVKAKLDGEVDSIAIEEIPPQPSKLNSVANDRQRMQDEEMKLVRLRITNLDPKKKDLPGEIFTVANEMLGVVKKYIPYGEATDGGYHVPYVIYRQLREREFLNIKTRKDNRGRTLVETTMSREFALEVLPQLTQKELNQLAAQQAAAAGMSN